MRGTGRAIASAKRLRRRLSLPELMLWRVLRLRRRALRVRRQQPIGPFVADFYCPAARLVIEIDGAAHDQRRDADDRRDHYMASLGLRVVRVSATEVLADPAAAADSIYRLCEALARPSTPQPDG